MNPAAAAEAQRAKTADDLPDIPGRTPAWHHQRQAYHFAKHLDAAMLALDMGCLHGDTIIHVHRGGTGWRMPIRELHRRWSTSWAHLETPVYVRGERDDGNLRPVRLVATQHTGVRETVTLTLDDGRTLRCTPDHELQTPNGKREAETLLGELVAVQIVGKYVDQDGYLREGGIRYAHRKNAPAGLVTHHIDGDRENNDPGNLAYMTASEHAKLHGAERQRDALGRFPATGRRPRRRVGQRNRFRFGYATVVSIEPSEPADVYDLSVDAEPHTYVADGFVVSNTGKSKTAIGLLEGWRSARVLVLCPVNVIRVWPGEFQRHAERSWRVAALDTSKSVAAREKSLHQAVALADAEHRPLAVLVNYEAAWREPIADALLNTRWDVVVCDESHRIKAPGGKASLFAARVGRRADRRLCLTGTPMAHTPLDLYAQYRFLDPAVYGTSYHRFKTRYAVWGGYENRQFRGMDPEYSAEFAARFASLAYQCRAEDVLRDLPEWREVERVATLEPAARRVYRQMSDDFVAIIDAEDDQVATAANAGVKVLRLQQITSGHLPDESGAIRTVSRAKEDLLVDVLADLPEHEPVVVFARFTADLRAIERVAAATGREYGELSGSRRDALTADAKLAPHVQLAGVQIQSGGVGIDLTRAATAVYYSVGHNLSDYQQSMKRIHRPGQTRPTLYVHLLTNAPIDRVVYNALRSREGVIEAVLRAAKTGTLKGES